MAEEKIDWGLYFERIKPVCPWSTSAWNKGEILITHWSGKVLDLGMNQAIVYIVKNHNRRRLKKLCASVDTDKRYDWLWSEPSHGPYASPVPVLIQQDSRKLFEARYNIGFYNDLIERKYSNEKLDYQ